MNSMNWEEIWAQVREGESKGQGDREIAESVSLWAAERFGCREDEVYETIMEGLADSEV